MKISENVSSELDSITEEECIDYVYNLVINRTYEGYVTEIRTIYGQLSKALGCEVLPAPDEWDRGLCVDFYIKVSESSYVGIQIKPVSMRSQTSFMHRWEEQNRDAHEKFTKQYGGKVFFVFSKKNAQGKKQIDNIEVIEEIRKEIERLNSQL